MNVIQLLAILRINRLTFLGRPGTQKRQARLPGLRHSFAAPSTVSVALPRGTSGWSMQTACRGIGRPIASWRRLVNLTLAAACISHAVPIVFGMLKTAAVLLYSQRNERQCRTVLEHHHAEPRQKAVTGDLLESRRKRPIGRRLACDLSP